MGAHAAALRRGPELRPIQRNARLRPAHLRARAAQGALARLLRCGRHDQHQADGADGQGARRAADAAARARRADHREEARPPGGRLGQTSARVVAGAIAERRGHRHGRGDEGRQAAAAPRHPRRRRRRRRAHAHAASRGLRRRRRRRERRRRPPPARPRRLHRLLLLLRRPRAALHRVRRVLLRVVRAGRLPGRRCRPPHAAGRRRLELGARVGARRSEGFRAQAHMQAGRALAALAAALATRRQATRRVASWPLADGRARPVAGRRAGARGGQVQSAWRQAAGVVRRHCGPAPRAGRHGRGRRTRVAERCSPRRRIPRRDRRCRAFGAAAAARERGGAVGSRRGRGRASGGGARVAPAARVQRGGDAERDAERATKELHERGEHCRRPVHERTPRERTAGAGAPRAEAVQPHRVNAMLADGEALHDASQGMSAGLQARTSAAR